MREGGRSATFDSDTRSVGTARRFVRYELDGLGVPEPPLEMTVLLTSEVVTNAVVHAGTPIGVRVSVTTDRVRVEVRDHDPRRPAPTERPLDGVNGRGLRMVRDVASAWGVEDEAEGKSVWFELAIQPDDDSASPPPVA